MKRYTEFTKEELATASDEEVQRLLDIEIMVSGLAPVSTPKTLCSDDIKLERKIKMWEVDDVLFETEDDAFSFIKLSRAKENYNYEIGYDIKFPVKSHDTEPKQKLLYSEADVLNSSELLKKAKSLRDIYDKERAAHNEYLKKKSNIESPVLKAIQDAKEFVFDVSKAREVLNKNLELSGDIAIATKFFEDQYKDRQDILRVVLKRS